MNTFNRSEIDHEKPPPPFLYYREGTQGFTSDNLHIKYLTQIYRSQTEMQFIPVEPEIHNKRLRIIMSVLALPLVAL